MRRFYIGDIVYLKPFAKHLSNRPELPLYIVGTYANGSYNCAVDRNIRNCIECFGSDIESKEERRIRIIKEIGEQ